MHGYFLSHDMKFETGKYCSLFSLRSLSFFIRWFQTQFTIDVKATLQIIIREACFFFTNILYSLNYSENFICVHLNLTEATSPNAGSTQSKQPEFCTWKEQSRL